MSSRVVLAFVPPSRRRALQKPAPSARASLHALSQDLSILAVRRPAMVKVFAEMAKRAVRPYR